MLKIKPITAGHSGRSLRIRPMTAHTKLPKRVIQHAPIAAHAPNSALPRPALATKTRILRGIPTSDRIPNNDLRGGAVTFESVGIKLRPCYGASTRSVGVNP